MEQNMTATEYKIREIALRIRELRLISGLSVEEMAQRAGVSVEEYEQCEAGTQNLSIAFLYRCVLIFGVDFSDLLEGRSPKLRSYPWDWKESDTTEQLTLRVPGLVNQTEYNRHQKSETRVNVCRRALR